MITHAATRLTCVGCDASPPGTEPHPFRCPNHGKGDVEHVLVKSLDVDLVSFPATRPSSASAADPPTAGAGAADISPFVLYRQLLHSYQRGLSGGIEDGEFCDLVRQLDHRVADIDGHGFHPTPFARSEALSSGLGFVDTGGVWVKDETGNVAGSHKARHLMGILLHLEVSDRLGLTGSGPRPTLAIASCGNAALAAAVVTAAGRRRLRVFVPADADPAIVMRLSELDAEVVACPRRDGEVGDPTYLCLLEELGRGALPFTCQGNLNGLAIEGGETLGYEIASDLLAAGLDLDHLVVQVGGGALASSTIQALTESRALGAILRLPAIHTVQTASVHPLERAYQRVRGALPPAPTREDTNGALRLAAIHRSSYMWPWESQPKSIATGILDDETYDWLAVVRGMLSSGGQPLVVDEDALREAHGLATLAGYRVDPTGSAGLAGLIALIAAGVVTPDQRVAVLFTAGARR